MKISINKDTVSKICKMNHLELSDDILLMETWGEFEIMEQGRTSISPEQWGITFYQCGYPEDYYYSSKVEYEQDIETLKSLSCYSED